ncbi:MAG: hypothetical protein Q9M14_05685, partial [Mariprofundaceae bacterium]|nr:hypothetical protein [Mariprofundaceae bacterium]
MKKLSLIQRIYGASFKPKQIMIVDANSRKPAKNWSIRPIALGLVPLIFVTVGVLAGSYYLPSKPITNMLPQYIQLQKKVDYLHNQLASSEANNEM